MKLPKPIKWLFSPMGTTLFLGANCALFALFLAQTINAQSKMSNNDYIIRMGNLNMSSGNVAGSGFKLGFTAGQTSPGLYSGSNYKVRAGFQYIHSIIPFAFSISSLFVDFGPLTPGAPVTRNNVLTVSNGSAYGYSVIASENHPLRSNPSGIDIFDTTCDDGSCTESVSAAWTNVLTYGFGYRCDNLSGTDCASGFASADNYKQFASSESAELAQAVMQGTNVGRNKQAQVTYKVNVSSAQAEGFYENAINFIAIPSI